MKRKTELLVLAGLLLLTGCSGKKETNRKAGIELPYQITDSALTVTWIGSYTGAFVEDGMDEPVTKAAALVVANHGEEMLQYAQLIWKVNEKEEATFQITTLPPGASVLVMESAKKSFSPEDCYSFEKSIESYQPDVSLQEDQMEIEGEDGAITLRNLSGKEMEGVYVYYKNIQQDGVYFGGITYRVCFPHIPAGEAVQEKTEHYSREGSQILMVE